MFHHFRASLERVSSCHLRQQTNIIGNSFNNSRLFRASTVTASSITLKQNFSSHINLPSSSAYHYQKQFGRNQASINKYRNHFSKRYNDQKSIPGGSSESYESKINKLLMESNKNVFVVMEGTKDKPAQYSEPLLDAIKRREVVCDFVNILEDPEVKQEIEAFHQSKKLPLLYIDGAYIGDYNDTLEMMRIGKLEWLLDESRKSDWVNSPTRALTISGPDKTHKDIPEQEFVLSTLIQKDLVPEVPLISLGIEKRITKYNKPGSSTADLFLGKFDDDFLNYPDPLDNMVESKQIQDQMIMVRQLWPQVWNDPLQLHKFNFHNLHQLSVTEMMTIFESIGHSMRRCCDPENSGTITEDISRVSQSIISLITRSCLTYWPIRKSKNERLKSLLPQKDLVFGGAAIDNPRDPYPPIGFCWTEMAPNLGSLPPQEWLSSGLGSPDGFVLKGTKHRVLFEENADNYLIFFRDQALSERYNQELPVNEPNPAADSFVGCCIVHKKDLQFSEVYHDSAGFAYRDVSFDTSVPPIQVVFEPERRDPTALNVKGLGQCASSAVMIGLLKEVLASTYVHLIKSKRGLLTCDIVEQKLADVTSKILALESMLYYIAGMYDGLESTFDGHMEAAILKCMTNDFTFEILRDIQQMCGSEMFFLSKLQDQANIFDSFLDGNIHNKVYIGLMGVLWFARSKSAHLNQLRLAPWYPGYLMKTAMRDTAEQKDWLTLNADIYGNLHPSLKEAATHLEFIMKRIKWITEYICQEHGSDVTSAQSQLAMVAQMTMDAFSLTALCARASKSYCNGLAHSGVDVALATHYSYELFRRNKLMVDELKANSHLGLGSNARKINQFNIKNGGYYAHSPLDPNI